MTTTGFLPGEPNEPRADEAHFFSDDEDYCSGDYRCRCPACLWVARRDAREDEAPIEWGEDCEEVEP